MSDRLLTQLRAYSLYRGIQPSTEYHVRHSVQLYSEHIGEPARLIHLVDELVSQWLAGLQERYAQRSVLSFRTNLLMLWRDCWRRGLVAPPMHVRRIKKPDPCPVAWTMDETRAIIAQCRRLLGAFPDGTPHWLYCESLARSAYDTGLRKGDLMRIRRAQITPIGAVVLRQSKTGGAHYPQLRLGTLELIRQLNRDPILKCPYANHSRFYSWWKEHVTIPAGVRHGVLQQMRRTGATQLAIENPEAVSEYLGHRSPEMAKYYIDRSQLSGKRKMPPGID